MPLPSLQKKARDSQTALQRANQLSQMHSVETWPGCVMQLLGLALGSARVSSVKHLNTVYDSLELFSGIDFFFNENSLSFIFLNKVYLLLLVLFHK